MKKVRLLLLISIALLSIFIFTSFVYAACSETDSGVDLYTKGTVTGNWLGDINKSSETHEDFCSDNNASVLQEYTCEETDRGSGIYGLVQSGVECVRGCNDGACIPISCEDSDNGDKFYTKGSVKVVAEGIEDRDDDTCVSNKVLAEQSCVSGQQKTTMFNCPGNCINGACVKIQTCSDSDGGNNIFEKGNLVANIISSSTGELERVESTDSCVGSGGVEMTNVIETYCIDDGMGGQNFNSVSARCLNGCVDGACIKIEPTEKTGPIILPTLPEETNQDSGNLTNLAEEDKTAFCSGCLLGNKCYPFGYRKEENYCSDDNKFIVQLETDNSCDNSFQCSSNVCVSGKCVSPSLLEKIFDWFKRLFGSD